MVNKVKLPEKSFDYETIIVAILYIEKNVPINEFKFKGILLWPFYRKHLWSSLLKGEKRNSSLEILNNKIIIKDASKNYYADKPKKHKSKIKKIVKYLRSPATSFITFFNFISSKIRERRDLFINSIKHRWELLRLNYYAELEINKIKKNIRSLKNIRETPAVLFHSKPAYYQLKANDGQVDVHIDPLVDIYQQEKIPVCKILTSQLLSDDKYHKEFIKLDMGNLKDRYEQLFNKITFGRIFSEKNELNQKLGKLDGLVENVLNTNKYKSHRNRITCDIIFNKWFYEKLFKCLKDDITCLYLACYYTTESMMIIHCAKKYGIKTVDVQHGKQGSPHGMYSHWENIPVGGYSTLPDIFWNWGEESSSSINQWIPQHARKSHRAIPAGYPRISYFLDGKYNVKLTSNEKNFLNKIKNHEILCLITLQPRNEIPNFVIQEMKSESAKCYWLVRLHPNMKIEEKEQIAHTLSSVNASKYDIKNSSKIDLYSLLSVTNVHITKWSSVGFEAALFNVPTIIVDPVGKYLYKKQIDDNEFYYAEDVNTLNEIVNSGVVSNSDYIVNDITLIKNTALEIYNASIAN